MTKKTLAAACLLLAAAGATATAQETKNPVWSHNWPDPTVWKADDGRYYSVCTNPKRCIVSDDLFRWEMSEAAPVSEESWKKMREVSHHFWAPDVATVDGKRNMYITLYNKAEDSNIGVLQETEPGRFEMKGIVTRGKETGIDDTIDPEVVTDPKTGKVWLFFGSVGGIHRVELTPDGLSLKEGAEYTHVAGKTVKENPDRSKVFEGAYLHRRRGYWYLFVSSGFYGNHTYNLRVGRSKKLDGTFKDRHGRPMTEGYATPVLWSDKGDNFFGPGHCGEIFRANDGNDYIFYHCHVRDSEKPQDRPMLMSRIRWDRKGWPYVEGGKPASVVTEP